MMSKKELEKIRPDARRLVIKSLIIDLSHQLYRDIWLRLTILLVSTQLICFLCSLVVTYALGIETISVSKAAAIGSIIIMVIVVLGNFISNDAMKKAKKTKGLLYSMIDTYDKLLKESSDGDR